MTRGIPETLSTAPLSETSYRSYYYYPAEKMLVSEWKISSGQMTDGGFKTEAAIINDLIKRYNPRLLLVDNTCFGYRIPPEIQEWYASTFGNTWSESALKRVAIIMEHDLLINLSVEMIGHYAAQMGVRLIETRSFSAFDTARKWLTGN